MSLTKDPDVYYAGGGDEKNKVDGGTLYLAYILTYLLNNWLENTLIPILVFTGIFVLGYLAIWAIIYSFIRRNTDKINEILKEKQQSSE